MQPQEAKAIAAVLYHGRLDWSSNPEFGHLERVALMMFPYSPSAEAVAWLHDAVEDGLTTFGALKDAGLDPIQYKALFLLTRLPEDGTYLDYIRNIRRADGLSGSIARKVKLADNLDNVTRPCPADKQGMRAPGGRYEKAREILEGKRS